MKVRFKNTDTALTCTDPVEQKLFRSGVPYGWAIMFHIEADVTSSDVDKLITPENIEELEFTNDEAVIGVVTGYSAIANCVIRHKADKTVVELQFTKTDASAEKNNSAK